MNKREGDFTFELTLILLPHPLSIGIASVHTMPGCLVAGNTPQRVEVDVVVSFWLCFVFVNCALKVGEVARERKRGL